MSRFAGFRQASARSVRGGYTIVEVLMAIVIFLALVVPLGYMTLYTAQGRTRARRIDDAVALAREEWGIVRRIPAKRLRDSVREMQVGERTYRVYRTVSDTVADGIQGETVQVGARRDSSTCPGVRVCVALREREDDDTIQCFGWRVPRVEMQP